MEVPDFTGVYSTTGLLQRLIPCIFRIKIEMVPGTIGTCDREWFGLSWRKSNSVDQVPIMFSKKV
jgi:hypothetical protein